MREKFRLWLTSELKTVASLIAGREMVAPNGADQIERDLYTEIIFELRDRRVKDEQNQRRLI